MTEREALAALRRVVGDVEQGTYREPKPVPFDVFAVDWLGRVEPLVKPSTLASYTGHVEGHLIPWLGGMRMDRISSSLLSEFVAEKHAARGRPSHARRCPANPDAGHGACQCVRWSGKTIGNALGTLRLILADAVKAGVIRSNPADGVRPPRRDAVKREALSVPDLEAALTAASEPWRTLFTVLAFTGLRRGEALGLTWGDVELDRGRLHVRRTRSTRFGTSTPKSAAGSRVVPLTPRAVDALRVHRSARPVAPLDPAADAGQHVFLSTAGTPIDADNVGRAWARTLRQAGVRHVPVHALRHTFATYAAAAGVPLRTLAAVIGHSNAAFTATVYAHALEADVDRVGTRLDQFLAEHATPPAEPLTQDARQAGLR